MKGLESYLMKDRLRTPGEAGQGSDLSAIKCWLNKTMLRRLNLQWCIQKSNIGSSGLAAQVMSTDPTQLDHSNPSISRFQSRRFCAKMKPTAKKKKERHWSFKNTLRPFFYWRLAFALVDLDSVCPTEASSALTTWPAGSDPIKKILA